MIVDLPLLFGLPALGVYLLLIAQLCLKQIRSDLPKTTFCLLLTLTISLACLLIGLVVLNESTPRWTYLCFAFASAPNFVLFWLVIRVLFEDDFSLGVREWGVGIAYIALMIWEKLYDIGAVQLPLLVQFCIGVFSLSLVLHLVWSLLSGRANDLIKDRRASRLWLVSLLIGSAFFAVVARNGVSFISGEWSLALSVLSISLGAFVASLYFLRLNTSLILFDKTIEQPVSGSLSARERQQFDKLVAYMENEKAYLDPALSIGKLAKSIGLGEHTLRSLINKSLGYRNYTDFMNQYRIAHAKAAFANPAQAHIPILTIALDSGYNSLSAFNRAFRLIEEKTPSEYRKTC